MIIFIILSIISKIGKYITRIIRLEKQASIRQSRRVQGGFEKHTTCPKRHKRVGVVKKYASCTKKDCKNGRMNPYVSRRSEKEINSILNEVFIHG